MSVLSKAYFHDEAAAFAHLEAVIWGDTPTCPHCGACDRISAIKAPFSKYLKQIGSRDVTVIKVAYPFFKELIQ